MELRVDESLLLDCARALIRAPSENPPGDEREAASVALEYATKAGLDARMVETAPNRCSVLATLDSGSEGPTLVWNGHIDVVPAMDHASWRHPPYDAVVEDGMLHGRGSADMKGACAAAIAAASALLDAGALRRGKLVLQLVADEEVLGPYGTQALYESGQIEADAAIVGEPTDLRICIAERGMAWVHARTAGVAAHGSQPHLGRNAIHEMAKVVLALRDMTWEREHPLLGKPTLNIGTIRGGAKINIVPADCLIEIDRRTLPGETHESLLEEIRDAIARAGAEAELSIVHSAEACEVAEDAAIVVAAKRAHREIRGADAQITGMIAATDAHTLLGRARIPTIIYGPGSLDQAHTTTEHVPVSELVDAARIYARIALDLSEQ